MVDGRHYDVVVLAGGRSRRMRVADKTALTVGGVTLLDRVLLATESAASVVVVGPERDVVRRVTWVADPVVGGGPAVAVDAALDHVTADVVVLLAADLPFITCGHLDRLADAVGSDGAVYVDADGSEQWLCSAWRVTALHSVELSENGSLRAALASLTYVRLTDPTAAIDCDTPDDLRRAEEMTT